MCRPFPGARSDHRARGDTLHRVSDSGCAAGDEHGRADSRVAAAVHTLAGSAPSAAPLPTTALQLRRSGLYGARDGPAVDELIMVGEITGLILTAIGIRRIAR